MSMRRPNTERAALVAAYRAALEVAIAAGVDLAALSRALWMPPLERVASNDPASWADYIGARLAR